MRPARTSRCGFRASWKANGRGVFDRLGDAFGRRRARRARRGGDDRRLKISTRISIVGGGVFDRDRRRDCVGRSSRRRDGDLDRDLRRGGAGDRRSAPGVRARTTAVSATVAMPGGFIASRRAREAIAARRRPRARPSRTLAAAETRLHATVAIAIVPSPTEPVVSRSRAIVFLASSPPVAHRVLPEPLAAARRRRAAPFVRRSPHHPSAPSPAPVRPRSRIQPSRSTFASRSTRALALPSRFRSSRAPRSSPSRSPR